MKLSQRIILGYGAILAVFAIVIGINLKLSSSLVENSNFLIRSEGIIRNSAQYQRTIIDMENCFRGYMLSGDKAFLQPYDSNALLINELYDTLQANTPDSSLQTNLLFQIKALYDDWKLNFADRQIKAKENFLQTGEIGPTENINLPKAGKTITDIIRKNFAIFNTYEYRLREQRREILKKSIRTVQRITVFLVVSAILLSLLSITLVTRVIIQRINELVISAGEIANGNFKLHIPINKPDEMNALSVALNTMAQKLSSNFADLERKNEDLSQFAHVVSHDLKAPLRGIEMVLNWIDEDTQTANDPKAVEYHLIIRGRLKRMENLINGILEISRIGRIQRPVERVDLSALLAEIVDTLSPPQGFHVHVQKNMPVLITEKVLLQQVFSNLIGNAIKYHDRPDGNVWVTVNELDNYFEFKVKDDGPGIDPLYHKKIFEIFQTLQERDAFESTGVGLAIVKKIVMDEKGGEIRVESKPGQGTAFVFTWPKFGAANEK